MKTHNIGFNPHTHEGCDIVVFPWHSTARVSIHTPTKGVTFNRFKIGEDCKFQSTHPRRVWQHWCLQGITTTCFNPHTHEGCDHSQRIAATNKASFNPHTHEGCDLRLLECSTNGNVFQSTHPRRVWLSKELRCSKLILFQSTHPRRVWLHIQQMAEYHDAKIIILRKMAK